MQAFKGIILFGLLITLIVGQSIVIVNFGCKSFTPDGSTCLVCSQRFYKDSQGICQPVSTSCKGYNSLDGGCTSCYDGFYLVETICVFDSRPPSNPYCAKFTNRVCTQCSRGYYLLNDECHQINPLCKTFDYVKLACTECYAGYELGNNGCSISTNTAVMQGCSQFNGSLCVKCARDYYVSANGACIKVNSLCKTFDSSNGFCLSCYPGFKVVNSTCEVDNSASLNPYCQKFQNNICSKCSNGYYFDTNNICTQVDPFCKSFDYTHNTCTSCYMGFALVNGSCIVQISSSSDPNCKLFDSDSKCVNCSRGFYFNNNHVCTEIDPKCKSFNIETLICGACYSGYELSGNTCVISSSKSDISTTCAQWLDDVCIKCSARAYYDINGNCVKVSDSCKTFNTFNGKCTTCYGGYSLNSNGECAADGGSATSCAQTDINTGLCIRCFNGSYLSADSQCVQIDSYCQIFDSLTRTCQQCYKGYSIVSGACQKSIVITTQAISNCVSYDNNANCVQCYKMYFLSNNQCNEVNPLCKTYDSSNGNCLSCYSSFTLQQNICVFA